MKTPLLSRPARSARPPTRIILSLSALALIATASVVFAGPLNPPAGPVASTYKTLSEVEPRIAINAANTPGDSDSLFNITQPGSYYLTGNITGVGSKQGIRIGASGVTLDLNGFDLVGVAGSFNGVLVNQFGQRNIAVINGSVRNWGVDGVNLGTGGATNCRVEGVLASGNAGNGISTGPGCMVTHCSANTNGVNGISTADGTTVSNCSVSQNTGNGISATFGTTVSNCSAYLNTGNGINTSAGCMVTNCSANANSGAGIHVDNGSTVADCTPRANTLDGIRCVSECIVRGNTCSLNGTGAGDGANIHAFGSDNRIEGNNCTGADRGIGMDAAGNIIIRNTCSGNTIDWVIAANNVFGPILDRRAPASAAVSGFSAASSLGSTDPNANFSY